MGPAGPAGAGAPGPQGPAGPAGTGAYAEDVASFAGFTPNAYTGNLGGRPAAHGICAAAFSGAHLCHASEYVLSTSMTPVPAAGAWVDASIIPAGQMTLEGSVAFGRHTDYSCNSFTSTLNDPDGAWIRPNGQVTWASTGACAIARPLACCNGAPKSEFAGFSAQSYTGSMGGRPAVHAICNTAFPGAHLCHAAEYLRTVSATPVPASGAWLDASVVHAGTMSLEGLPSAGRETDYSCDSFTSTVNDEDAAWVQQNGEVTWASTGGCAVARPVACCY
ncbi:Phage tail fiber protein [Chondromyces apiculatus DSM 436]|uniref:Phage tail fiber protein n=2 Tax=Chondromyces apiculatus TaxID=51 RepID=A0A017T7T9_9BACT|nr:Phage tail fiber protein [Chondromyces apiculatus DSM 436]